MINCSLRTTFVGTPCWVGLSVSAPTAARTAAAAGFHTIGNGMGEQEAVAGSKHAVLACRGPGGDVPLDSLGKNHWHKHVLHTCQIADTCCICLGVVLPYNCCLLPGWHLKLWSRYKRVSKCDVFLIHRC